MGDKKKPRRVTLADELDATCWDFQPGQDNQVLLRPVGSVLKNVPWDIEPQYLGPAPIAEIEIEEDVETDTDTDDDVDTQPIEPLER